MHTYLDWPTGRRQRGGEAGTAPIQSLCRRFSLVSCVLDDLRFPRGLKGNEATVRST